MTETENTSPDFEFDPVPVRYRHDGWTPEVQAEFIAALAETGCVTMAAKRVGKSAETAYRLRRHYDGESFRLAWDAALDYAVRRISDAAFSRAIYGEPVPHYYQGEMVGEHRRYDNRLAMFIMRYRDPLRYGKHLDKAEYHGSDELMAIRLGQFMNYVENDSPVPRGGRRRRRRKIDHAALDNGHGDHG